ncbi:ATP-binding cassette domain-containing protein [Arthrobacter sp. I2-34]|uniref:ATP-binding cassette domain-containing protein n=1 Tax=Arthrobacter hankyongi TaxID=2904801 RepID=A0ABS9L3K2_9MICC|nr:ATP-binding cassette domain-containing protein [Arthrobacter hankyongi]MCG2621221.1 ATP-binding cassette domain-containing protein [Arthrobacter hankyongi]
MFDSIARMIGRPLLAVNRRWNVLGPVLALLLAAFVAALPWLGLDIGWQRQIILIAVLALVVSGLNLSFGYAGELALGQVFMYAAGAYTAGWLGKQGVTNIVVVLVVAIVAALLLGVITGAAGLRLGGWMLALTSLFFITLIPRVVNLMGDELGGFAGMAGISRPTLFGEPMKNTAFYLLVIICSALWIAVMRNLVKSREGTAFLVLKESPVLARTLGVSVYRTKLRAYALGGVPAGIAGVLYAYLDGYVSPGAFTFELGLIVLAAGILGGVLSIYGAILGAAVLQLGPARLSVFDTYAEVAYGVLLIVGGVLLSMGIAGIGHRFMNRLLAAARHDADAAPEAVAKPEFAALNGKQLEVSGVVVRFGGFTALDGVSMQAKPGEITALIGPNGSGKTTLLNAISGLIVPKDGEVSLDGTVFNGDPKLAAGSGIARTFQTPLIPSTLTVHEVAASGRLLRGKTTFVETVLRLPRYRRARIADRIAAGDALAAVGISSLADAQASTLPLGTRRLLEFARAIANEPSVLLLDEVASGLDENELKELAALIRGARDAGATVVLVEHNFELVRQISDHVVVLAEGKIIAQGDAGTIASDERVVNLYLGADIMHAHSRDDVAEGAVAP